MNATTKQRFISTSIWDDDWFDSLSEREKLAYFYLLTNPHTNAAGVYQCTLKNMRLEMGLEREELERIMGKFAAAGKAFYLKDYIIIPKWLKHQKVGERSTIMLGVTRVLKSLPEEIKAFIRAREHYDYDVSDIIGYGYPIDSLSPTEDSLCQNYDSLSKKGDSLSIAYPQKAVQNAHDSDSDLDLDLDLNSDSDLDIDSDLDDDLDSKKEKSLSEKPVDNYRPPPKDLHDFIKKRLQAFGFYVDDPIINKISESIPDKTWIYSKHDIFDFVLEKIKEIYPNKPKEQHRRLFISAITKWKNIQEEYPVWVDNKKQADKLRLKIPSKPPDKCTNCGGELKSNTERLKCTNCGALYDWNGSEWVCEIQSNEPYF
jgi:hypothetical protein